jgi:uncharacterized lipoprotein YddW (UPF0748 family)
LVYGLQVFTPCRLGRFTRLLMLAVLVAAVHTLWTRQAVRASTDDEVRALWVQRASLTTPESIAQMVETARLAGFNTLLVQVRGRGDAYFRHSVEPRAVALAGQSDHFDPLATVLKLAREAGLRVHAWVNVNLVANVHELPLARKHLVYRHPEWLMVPRSLTREIARIDPDRPEYVEKLVRTVRTLSAQVEGLYVSPIPDGAAAYTTSVIEDLARRYDVDGIHFDYIRYPNEEFDYSPAALSRFRRDVIPDLTRSERNHFDARLRMEPTIYADAFPERWRQFRRDRLTRLLIRLRAAVKSRRPNATVSAAVFPDARDAVSRRLQDWPLWTSRGLLDVICPMAYTTNPAAFRAQIESARQLAGDKAVWAGIGAYRLSSSETIESIMTAREIGARGVVLFSYDNLATLPGQSGALSDIGRAAFNH